MKNFRSIWKQEYERALSGGASDDEARRQVLEQLNASDLLGRELKHVERRVSQQPTASGSERKTNIFADLMQDLRYGLRMLAKNPAFTSIAVIALALGIGANSAIFSVVDAVLLRPLPFKHPKQLVMLWENAAHHGFPKNTPSPANFLDWQKQAISFTGIAAMAERSFNLTGVGEPERLEGRRVSANLFELLGVSARLGRTFVPEDDKPGTHVVLLSHSLWQRRFGSDPASLAAPLLSTARATRSWASCRGLCNCLATKTGTISSGCRLRSRRRKRRSVVIIFSK